jgi:hypothetical protein
MFNPSTEYLIIEEKIPVKDFHEYREDYIVRPPYQRKNVWSRKKQQALLDSLFRRYYVPRIVMREIRLSEDRTVYEIVDGQQRINTVQRFYDNDLKLPKSLADVSNFLPHSTYEELDVDIRRFVDKKIVYTADVVKNIDDPQYPDHQEVATEIFWRLQQGETLNYMEVAHSQLSSIARNFVVKYSDDIRFDYKSYRPIDSNPDKHQFFSVIERNNNRMQHLALLTRFLIIEDNETKEIPDIKHNDVEKYINKYKKPDGIASLEMEEYSHAQNVLKIMSTFYDVFKDDEMIDDNSGMKELKTEYFIISVYLLLRHLQKYYVFDEEVKTLFHDFVIDFHDRWSSRLEDDNEILIFSDNRQQSGAEIETRDRIIRQLFFEYARKNNHTMLTKDKRRSFSEAEKIEIYRRDNGLCQMCLDENKPKKEAQVSWSDYEADHVLPHSQGGMTMVDNAQVLCTFHNRQKGSGS